MKSCLPAARPEAQQHFDFAIRFSTHPFVAALARRYNLDLEDCRQEAFLAAAELADKFDSARGASLETFLFSHLRRRLQRQAPLCAVEIDENQTFAGQNEELDPPAAGEEKIKKIAASWSLRHGMVAEMALKSKSTSEIAEKLKLTPRRVRQILAELTSKPAMVEGQLDLFGEGEAA